MSLPTFDKIAAIQIDRIVCSPIMQMLGPIYKNEMYL